MREILAAMGVRSMAELIGRPSASTSASSSITGRPRGSTSTRLFHKPDAPVEETLWTRRQEHPIADVLDRKLIEQAKVALETRQQVRIETAISNVDRSAGAMLAGEVAKRFGPQGSGRRHDLREADRHGGQSFAAFLARGITFDLVATATTMSARACRAARSSSAARELPYRAEESIIVGNTVLYGAIAGECYFRGVRASASPCATRAPSRWSRAWATHGCEYMTGGVVVILGHTGRNFAAGMSGGIAYVYDPEGNFAKPLQHGHGRAGAGAGRGRPSGEAAPSRRRPPAQGPGRRVFEHDRP